MSWIEYKTFHCTKLKSLQCERNVKSEGQLMKLGFLRPDPTSKWCIDWQQNKSMKDFMLYYKFVNYVMLSITIKTKKKIKLKKSHENTNKLQNVWYNNCTVFATKQLLSSSVKRSTLPERMTLVADLLWFWQP